MSKEHEALKQIAVKILIDMGFTMEEIKEEYWVSPYSLYSRRDSDLKGFRVDVVGLKPNKKVAIECGKTPGEKIAALKMFFDQVIVLPYFSLNTDKLDLERVIREKNQIISDQNKKITELTEQKISREASIQLLKDIGRDWMELLSRNSASGMFLFYDLTNKSDFEILDILLKEAAILKAKMNEEKVKPTESLPLATLKAIV